MSYCLKTVIMLSLIAKHRLEVGKSSIHYIVMYFRDLKILNGCDYS